MGQQAGTVLLFGIDTPEQTYGLLQTYDIVEDVQRAEAIAPDGAVVSIQEYKDTWKLTLTYILLSEGTGDPEIGTNFTFDGYEWHIDNIKYSKDVSGFRTATLTAKNYPVTG